MWANIKRWINLLNTRTGESITGSSSNGPCIVLLHGFLESLCIWDEFVNELSKDFKVLTIDLPGHGKTENFSEVHTMEFMAETVKAVLEHLKIEKCVLIGHSMGGYVRLLLLKSILSC